MDVPLLIFQEPNDVMDVPPVILQKPNNVMDVGPVILQESDDIIDIPPLIFQEPDDVMDIPPVILQESDDIIDIPPLIFQEPDDVMDIPPVILQESDDIIDIPPLIFQEPDDVMDIPPVILQESDDIIDIPPLIFQEPDDFKDIPPGIRQEKYDVTDDPSMILQRPNNVMDSFPVMFQHSDDVMDSPPVIPQESDNVMDVPPAILQQSNNVMDIPPMILEQPDDVREDPPLILQGPNDFLDSLSVTLQEPDDNNSNPQNDRSKPSQDITDHRFPGFTVAVFGNGASVQFGCDNILLGEKQTCVENTESCIIAPLKREISHHHVSVINMIDLHETDVKSSDDVFGQLVNDYEIHAFIFVVPLGQLTDDDRMGIEWLKKIFSERVLSFAMILFTYDREEEYENIIDELKKSSALEKLVETCGGRYHTCSKTMNNQPEMIGLMDKIQQIFTDSFEQGYTSEIYNTVSKDLQCREHQTGSTSDESTISQTQRSSSQTEENERKRLCVKQLMGRLHLDGKDIKLGTVDFLQLTENLQSNQSCSEERFVQTFLQKLLMMDYRARNIQLKENVEENNTQRTNNESLEDAEDAFEDIFNESLDIADKANTSETIDLMDAQMALFHCADRFLKQLIVTKLSQCQFALPLLVPNPFTQQIEFPLWTFRQIKKSWRISEKTSKTLPVYAAETPMVAFFRFGSVSTSKSQLINSLINEKHNTFFNRNCPGSSRSRILMDGVVEIAWYCPSGEKTDTFPQCVAFCNLHGDAEDHEKQLNIITQMSSVNVAILPQMNKNDNSMTKIQNLYKDSKPLICLLTENNSSLTEMRKDKKFKMGLKNRNQSVVFEDIRKAVHDGLSASGFSSHFKLEDVANQLYITVDEMTDEDCRKGKDAAQKMMSLLKDKDLTQIKESFLPCQGKLWHQWCQKNKELHRPTLGELHKHENIEKTKSYKKTEMLEIRAKQQTSALKEFNQIFIQELSSQKSNQLKFFLNWLGNLMDDFTTESLSALHLEYDVKWSTVLDLKNKNITSQKLMAAQELERISEKLQAATFGLEHILREVSQIYESCSTVKKNKTGLNIDFRALPGLAAKMMMSGYPLELMDGDAAHVPLIWVTAVLDELIQKLGDKRVFVLSVLGIQSSGKSTMLNAMFGLQFAVSAGRCTRGAFMQLVKVSEEMKMTKQMEFEYILVVDTEGLRALELAGRSTRNHDNELATFVVGLGNMTLINIFGENTAEMQDILQIVVQAFLRMKKVRLNPSCMFVHQNVSDVAAGEKNMEGRRRLQEKLDEMTKLAAKEEECVTECFNDVIAFDVQNDVKYFAQLWEGSPPMAPPNPNYSRNIQELKENILAKASRSGGITLSQFKMRINDLWNALLNENFVFSFKNTLEISVYRKLETKYSDWTWRLRSAMLSIEDRFYNRIENGNTEVKQNDLLAEMLKTKQEVEKSLNSYFDEDKDKDILCQWRGRFETQIKNLHEDLVKGTNNKLKEAIEQKKARENVDIKKTEYENKLLIQSKELALKLKGEGTDEHFLKEEFDTLWSRWVTEISQESPPMKDFHFWDDVTQILNENNELTFVNERLNLQDFKQIVNRGDYDEYIIQQAHVEQSDFEPSKRAEKSYEKKKSGLLQQFVVNPTRKFVSFVTGNTNKPKKRILNAEYHESIRQLIHEVKQEIEKIMAKLQLKRHGYNDSYIQELTDCVKKSVQKHQEKNQKYKLKREFTIDLCLYVCDNAMQTFTEHHKDFRKSNDPRIYLEKQKTQYYNIFKNYCKGATSTTILIDFICSKLEQSILEVVYNKTAIDLAAQMRSDIQSLRENRPNLEKHILKSLAEKEDFNEYIKYIFQPKEHFKQFIKKEVNKYLIEQSEMILNIFKGNLKQKEQIVSNAVHAVTVEVKNNRGNGNLWFRGFKETLTDELKFTGESCVDLTEVKDLDFLGKHLSESLNEMMMKLQNSLKSMNDVKMEKFRKKPDEILIDHFCQCCWVQCPFCKAICTNTMEDHSGDHCVPFHRNNGLNGWFYRGTTNLSINICTTAVSSDRSFYPNSSDEKVLWKEYRKGGPKYANWSITPDLSELPYWKWFVCRFQKDLENHYSKTYTGHGEIPKEWREYTKKDAIECLDKYL